MRNFNDIKNQVGIVIICEGNEEYEYISKLNSLGVWHDRYHVVPVNARGIGSISAYYQNYYQNESYDLVFALCDTDKKPYDAFNNQIAKISNIFGSKNAAESVVFYGNPCTMDIIIKHIADIDLKSNSKSVNSSVIEEHTGIESYDAHHDQIMNLMKFVTKENYHKMKHRIKSSDNPSFMNTTNINILFKHLEDSNTAWVKDLNRLLDEN